MATLVPSWGQLRWFWGCVEGYMGFWTMLLRHSQKQPKDTPPKRSPPPLKAKQNQIKNRPKTQKLHENANLSQNLPSKRSLQWPCSLNLLPGRQIKGPPSRAIWDDDVFAKVTSSKARAPLARPAPTERCGRILLELEMPKTDSVLDRWCRRCHLQGLGECCDASGQAYTAAQKLLAN